MRAGHTHTEVLLQKRFPIGIPKDTLLFFLLFLILVTCSPELLKISSDVTELRRLRQAEYNQYRHLMFRLAA